jgi:hypothetical protein
MSTTIHPQDGVVLINQAQHGDVQQLRQTLDHIAQHQGPNGFDRADILLLAKDEAGNNAIHAACIFNNTSELIPTDKVWYSN